jgi:hypothetical protein
MSPLVAFAAGSYPANFQHEAVEALIPAGPDVDQWSRAPLAVRLWQRLPTEPQ